MTRNRKPLAQDESGASIIEMALLLPFLASMVVGVADISRAYSAKLKLEQAAYRSIEKVQQYRDTSSTFSTISAEATTAAVAAGFTSPSVTTRPVARRRRTAGSPWISRGRSRRCSPPANGRARMPTAPTRFTAKPD